GGSGFYGVVNMKFGPSGSEENIFAEDVFGGAVPRNYFPAVEKGFLESIKQGLLAGFPVIGMKATLFDGKYHPVDSNELAFQMCIYLAYKDCLMQRCTTSSESIVKRAIKVDNEYTCKNLTAPKRRRTSIVGIHE